MLQPQGGAKRQCLERSAKQLQLFAYALQRQPNGHARPSLHQTRAQLQQREPHQFYRKLPTFWRGPRWRVSPSSPAGLLLQPSWASIKGNCSVITTIRSECLPKAQGRAETAGVRRYSSDTNSLRSHAWQTRRLWQIKSSFSHHPRPPPSTSNGVCGISSIARIISGVLLKYAQFAQS